MTDAFLCAMSSPKRWQTIYLQKQVFENRFDDVDVAIDDDDDDDDDAGGYDLLFEPSLSLRCLSRGLNDVFD